MIPSFQQWLDRGKEKTKKTYRIPKVTKKRAAANREYAKRRVAYLKAHPFCQIYLRYHNLDESAVIARNGACVVRNEKGQTFTDYAPRSNQIHHAAKPKCKYLNDESTWFAASPKWHEWAEQNKKEARRIGVIRNN
jgi:hypothetical protein